MSLNERLIKSTKLTEIADLLNNGADIETVDSEGNTLLLIAVKANDYEIVNLLVSRGANLTHYNHCKWGAIHIAVLFNKRKILELLIRNMPVKHESRYYGELLCWTLKKEYDEISNILIEKGADANYEEDYDDGWNTPLIWASNRGNLQIVEKLINLGADVNWINKNSATALMKACENGHYEIYLLLLNNGANINQTKYFYKCDKNMLHFAIEGGNLDIIRDLLSRGFKLDKSMLKRASYYGRVEAVKFLIEIGGDLYDDVDLCKALISASYSFDFDFNKGNGFELVKFFVQMGANVNFFDEDSDYYQNGFNTPLIIAVNYKNYEIVKYLLTVGADVNIKNTKGKTPLMIAKKLGYDQLVKILEEHIEKIESI